MSSLPVSPSPNSNIERQILTENDKGEEIDAAPPSFEPFINALLEPAAKVLTELHERIGNAPESTPKDLSDARLHIQALTQKLVDQAREAAKDVVSRRQRDAAELSKECNDLVSDVDDLRLALGEDGKRKTRFKAGDLPESLTARRDRLKEEFHTYTATYDQRIIKLDGLLDRLRKLHAVLGDKLVTLPPESEDKFKDVTSFSMRTMEQNIQRAEGELARRKDAFKTSLIGLSNSLIEIVEPLPEASNSEDEAIVAFEESFYPQLPKLIETEDENIIDILVETLNPTDSLLEHTESLRAGLEDEKIRREEEIQTVYDQLNPLWDKLDVDESQREQFINTNMGSTLGVIEAYHQELDRMLELKRENMALFVQRIRGDIEKLWDYMQVGSNERSQFTAFTDDSFNDECLAEHENILAVLQEEKNTKGKILTKVHLYNQIVSEEIQLQESANDASRLLGRGPRDPGRLIREEKMRKRVAKKSQIESDLLEMLESWENENARMFLINDEHFAETLKQRIASKAQEKENKRKGKGGGPPPVTRKASNSSLNGSTNSTTTTNKRKPLHAPQESITPAPSAKRMRVGSAESNKGVVNSITKSTHSHNSAIKPKRMVNKQAPPRYPIALSSVAESPANGHDPFGKPAQAQARSKTMPSKKSRRSSFKPETRVASVSSVIDHQYAELEAIAAGEEEDW